MNGAQIETQLRELLKNWDELAASAHKQGIEKQELYFHGVELGFEMARDQLARVIAESMRSRAELRDNLTN